MSTRLRLTVVATHPVQYHSPWFRYVARHCPEIDLTVLYATVPTAAQQGVGFGRAFEWDVALLEGYRSEVARPARPGDNVHSDAFRGLDVPEIVPALRRTRPDVVLIFGWYSITLVRALRECRRAGIPVLYRGDTNLLNAPRGLRRPAWGLKTYALLRQFDGYLSPGRRVRAYLDHFGVPGCRIHPVPHCVDNEFFAARSSSFQTERGRRGARQAFDVEPGELAVLFVGKLEPKKRVHDVIEAVARQEEPTRLIVVGTGQDEAAARCLARERGVNVHWAGFLNQSELGKAYAAADCLVLPSDAGETWGLVVNEAMATGLPCIVSDRVGCGPDLVATSDTGEVFPCGDQAALADAIARLRGRRAAGHDYATACRAHVAGYSYEDATRGLLQACRAVAHERVPRGAPSERSERPVRVVACCGDMSLVSGLERMTFEVLRVLRRDGAAVHCVVNTWAEANVPGGPHPIVALAEGIGATWSTSYSRRRLDRRARNPIALARIARDVWSTSAGLWRDARRFRATHVLVPESIVALRNAPALALLRAFGVRVVLRAGTAPVNDAFYRRVWRWGVNPVVHQVVANSRFTRDAILKNGMPTHKVSYIYNAAPTRSLTFTTSDVPRHPGKIVYIGQLIPEKGVHLLLDAVTALAAVGLDVCLDVLGRIGGWEHPTYRGYHQRLIDRADQPDLRHRVRFLGQVEDVARALAGGAVHCCPSLPEQREAFGVVNVEAKMAGVPSVVFPTGALPELIEHGTDGWICSDCSVEALTEGLAYFLAEPERARQAGLAALASADRFSRERFAREWRAVFRHQPASRPLPDPASSVTELDGECVAVPRRVVQ